MTVPNVVGQAWGSAESLLRSAGFVVIRQEQAGGTPGQVLAQEPPGGQALPPESVITLRVASNTTSSNQIVVPDIVGRTEAEAKELLRGAGLTPSQWTNYQDMESLPPNLRKPVCIGCVLSSSPSAGAQVGAGATINLAVRSS
jgi:serine/threonine-protein kinase